MAGYLGNTQKISGRYTVDEFTSSGGTTYTLSKTPGAKNNIQVSAGGLVQYPSAYSVSGTTLTLSGVPSGQKVVVRHMGDTIPFPLLDDNVVTTAKIAAGAVGTTDIADDAVTLAKLSATGTASASNFLRGDNSWQEAGGGAWNVILSTNITSATTTVNFVHGTGGVVIDSTYQYYVLVGSHVIQSAAGGTSIKLSSDAGSSWYAGTNYSYTSRRYGGSSPAGAFSAGTTGFDITPSIEPGPATGMPNNWTAEFWNLSQATSPKSFHSKMICTRSGTISETYGSNIWGNLNVNAAMNGIQVISDGGGGNFVSGRMTLYGIAHA